jgi:hypothetical protein
MMFELLLDVMDRFLNLRDTVTSHPTGGSFRGGAVPGTSWQATIALSLRDISSQGLR